MTTGSRRDRRGPTVRPARRVALLLARLAFVLLLAAIPVITPTAAEAATMPVSGFVDCVIPESSGGFTAVMGYSNSWGFDLWLPHGWLNNITPSRYQGEQPTVFKPGEHHGVFSLHVTAPYAQWNLFGTRVRIDPLATACPQPTEMPGEGNGTGIVIAIVVAGLAGAVLVHRMRKHLAAASAAPPSGTPDPVQETDRA